MRAKAKVGRILRCEAQWSLEGRGRAATLEPTAYLNRDALASAAEIVFGTLTMRAKLAAPPEETVALNEFLTVRAGGQDFALGVMAVREIRGWTASTPLPDMPHYIRGMINLRGAVLGIMDLAARLDLASNEPTALSVVVVVEVDQTPIGLLVDEVCDIIMVGPQAMQPVPRIGPWAGAMVERVITLADRIVSVITVEALAPDAQLSLSAAA